MFGGTGGLDGFYTYLGTEITGILEKAIDYEEDASLILQTLILFKQQDQMIAGFILKIIIDGVLILGKGLVDFIVVQNQLKIKNKLLSV